MGGIADDGYGARATRSIADAASGQRVNGARRGQNSAAYDWLRNGRRVECKSAQLRWNRTLDNWLFQFRAVSVKWEVVILAGVKLMSSLVVADAAMPSDARAALNKPSLRAPDGGTSDD